jgi:hypothetical protein
MTTLITFRQRLALSAAMVSCIALVSAVACLHAEDAAGLDTAAIETATGLKGVLNQDEAVFKVSSPRSDVKITVDGAALPPFMGVTSWAAFKADPKGGAMVMGDLVLFEDEVNPVMSALLAHGVSVTAIHNHFFHAVPAVWFMHIGGVAPAATLAAGVRAAFDQVKAIRAAAPQPAAAFAHAPIPAANAITAAPLEAIFGSKATAKDGMAKFTIGRSATMSCGCVIGKEMGVNTWAAFMGSDEQAVVDGDFATVAGELQTVLKTLRAGGVDIVAIHSHMEDDTPKYIFLHYWGVGPATALARTVKAALDAQKAISAK